MSTSDGVLGNGLMEDLDRVIHGRARLVLMVLLARVEEADFAYLREESGLTWGNLSANLMQLEAAGYVEIRKTFKGKRPQTWGKLSAAGAQAFTRYRRHMKDLLDL